MEPDSPQDSNPPQLLLNHLSLRDEVADIGKDVLEDPKSDLFRIPKFLGKKLEERCRRTQSIITRSEAEFLGISSPRFACRAYLTDGGFINCRRFEHYIKNSPSDAELARVSRYSEGQLNTAGRNPDLGSSQHPLHPIEASLRGQSCVADCLLAEPGRLKTGQNMVRYLDVDIKTLFDIYAEPRPKNLTESEPTQYTPYVKTVDFGGGLCAQAVCFVATLALSKHANKLSGLAEITAYTHDPECRELALSGLTPAKMQNYFRKVGLNVSEQSPDNRIRPILREGDKTMMTTALRCYLQSNMPVIFPVDCQRMASQPTVTASIYATNASPFSPSRFPPNSSHAIILVGYSHAKGWFIFHDPFVLPYMVAPASKLALVGCHRGGGGPDIVDNGVFMPVTPDGVQMPLLWERRQDPDTGKVEHCAGLFTISSTLHVLLHNLTHPNAFSHSGPAPFMLARGMPSESDLIAIPVEQRCQALSEIQRCLEAGGTANEALSSWWWYEVHTDSIWIWDAERPPTVGMPETHSECQAYLRAIIQARQVDQDGKVVFESLNITP